MHMLAEDIEAGGGDLKIRQSDASTFEVGRNLAMTPGKVIFQNELMQLIQYAPSTDDGAEAPAADRAALDQQVLHSRSDAGKILHQMVRRPGPHGVRDLLGQSGRAASRKKDFEDYMRDGVARGARRHRAGDRREQGPHHRLLRRRHAAVVDARLHGRPRATSASPRRPSSPRRSTSPMPAISRCSSTRSSSRRSSSEMGERGYLEGTQDGARLQPAALERPDLALRHQQLSARARRRCRSTCCTGIPTRPACRRPTTRSICATAISRTRSTKGEMTIGGVTLDLQQGEGADLQSRHPRGPHRAGEVGVARLEVLRRPGAIRAVRLRPHRRRRQSAGQAEVPVLDRRRAAAASISTSWLAEGEGASGLVVAGLARPGSRPQDATEVPAREPGGGKLKPIEDAPGRYVKVRD